MRKGCTTLLYVSGSRKELNQYKKLMLDNESQKPLFDYKQIIPSVYLERTLDPLCLINKRGTTEKPTFQDATVTEDNIEHFILTHSDPPDEAIKTLSYQFPELTFHILACNPMIELGMNTYYRSGAKQDYSPEDEEEYLEFESKYFDSII